MPVSIFFSYAHTDEDLRDRLAQQLSILRDVAQAIFEAVKLRVASQVSQGSPMQPSLPNLPQPSQDRELSDQEIGDRYLDSQRYAVENVRSEGIPQQEGIFTTLLEEVFVPLALATSTMIPGFMPLDLERAVNGFRIWDFLVRADEERNCRQLVILAWGGYGKTTLLKHIAYIYGSRQHSRYGVPQRIPVFLPLRQYRALLTRREPPSLAELIATHHAAKLPDGKALPIAWVQLNMMLRFHRQYPGADLPKRRVKLYEEICRLQLKVVAKLFGSCHEGRIIREVEPI
jgi:hypothetical protein